MGDKVGHYEILGPLGAGGMGEVYKARDKQLEREVAIKVLPQALARDPERLARFDREAKVLATLNHPNIAVIYGLVESDAGRALVMELVHGDTLGARIKRGVMPLEEALQVARQIAEALEAAHEKGVTHRDLKPGNVMITPAGLVKVLDFGLATISTTGVSADPDNSPTLTMGMTQTGAIMGTASYMSPEQAEGMQVDKRADIWSFGVVLWEMLVGKRLFERQTVSRTLASVLQSPIDFDKPTAPAPIKNLLRRCLERDVRNRLRDIGEARFAVQQYLSNPTSGAKSLPHKSNRLPWVAAAAGLAIAAVLAVIHFRETPPAVQTLRYTIAAPEGTVHSFAISPDGRYLVIAAGTAGKQQLWLRALDALQAQAMPFTEDATFPFWSPDSRYIAFFAQGKLKKVAASGGPSQSLCDVSSGRGGTWGRDDVIVFSPSTGGISLRRVAAGGGVPVDIMQTKGDQRHPTFLPDGRQFLYLARGGGEQRGIYVSSTDGPPGKNENRRLLADDSAPVFAPPTESGRTGHILFVRQNTLMAVPFDAVSAQLTGDVFPVTDGVSLTSNQSYLPATVSDNGLLVYASGGAAGTNQLAWMDRTGKSLGPVGAPGAIMDPALSPDEKSVALRRGTDLWLRELSRGAETRFTSVASGNIAPFWSPKGDRILFMSNRKGGIFNLYQKLANGSGQDELLLEDGLTKVPMQWSRDGRFIVYAPLDPKTKLDLWVLPAEGAAAERKPIPFIQSEFDEVFGQLSPDSHWMAFTSDRSGRREVYVRPFPPGDGEYPISTAGGEMPRWKGDGKEIYFEGVDGKMMAVAVKTSVGAKPVLEASAPVALFDAHMVHNFPDTVYQYDVTADGKRFLINTTGSGAASALPLTAVSNWIAAPRK